MQSKHITYTLRKNDAVCNAEAIIVLVIFIITHYKDFPGPVKLIFTL